MNPVFPPKLGCVKAGGDGRRYMFINQPCGWRSSGSAAAAGADETSSRDLTPRSDIRGNDGGEGDAEDATPHVRGYMSPGEKSRKRSKVKNGEEPGREGISGVEYFFFLFPIDGASERQRSHFVPY